tara:strand:+ start:903 stop:1034 length:132 start_codon:yes stop_codon:yes gene_type:complete
MNIKIPRKRAEEIAREEVERFLKENKNVDRRLLNEFLKKGEEK